MSVIAWDGRVLAADKASTDNGLVRSTTKIRCLPDGTLIGSVGDVATGNLLEHWYQDGSDVTAYPDKEMKCNLVVIKPDGKVWLYDGGPYPELIEEKIFAMGTGRTLAIGAMEAGASAEWAVKIACRWDSGCGIGVTSLNLQGVVKDDIPF